MKIRCAVLFLCLGLSAARWSKDAAWSGNYTDKKYLNGQAVFQLNILQEGDAISIDFDAAYNDGHSCAPQASGQARIEGKDTLRFTFTDSSNNGGTGTIRRVGDGVVISLQTTRVADPKCVVFYGENIRLGPAR